MVRPRRQKLGQRQEIEGSTARGGCLGKRREDSGEKFDRKRFRSRRYQTTAYQRTQRILTMSKILDMGEDVFEEPVRDFYMNLIWDEGRQAVKGFLRGRDFWIRAENIYEIVSEFHPDTLGLSLPYSNYRQFMQEWRDRYAEGLQEEGDVAEWRPPTDAMIAKALADNQQMDPAHICQTNMLAPIRIRILEKVIRSIIVLKGGDKAALTDLVKIIMVCLIFKEPLDLSRLILMMMRECAQQGRRALGYEKLIIALLRKEQFNFSLYHPTVLESAIDEKVTAMTNGERTRRSRAQIQEERA